MLRTACKDGSAGCPHRFAVCSVSLGQLTEWSETDTSTRQKNEAEDEFPSTPFDSSALLSAHLRDRYHSKNANSITAKRTRPANAKRPAPQSTGAPILSPLLYCCTHLLLYYPTHLLSFSCLIHLVRLLVSFASAILVMITVLTSLDTAHAESRSRPAGDFHLTSKWRNLPYSRLT